MAPMALLIGIIGLKISPMKLIRTIVVLSCQAKVLVNDYSVLVSWLRLKIVHMALKVGPMALKVKCMVHLYVFTSKTAIVFAVLG